PTTPVRVNLALPSCVCVLVMDPHLKAALLVPGNACVRFFSIAPIGVFAPGCVRSQNVTSAVCDFFRIAPIGVIAPGVLWKSTKYLSAPVLVSWYPSVCYGTGVR
ncbi:unnamed protein product, partial [Ectocarpus fasciculatus]